MNTDPKSNSAGYACQACEDRAAVWLTAYLEEWNGPKARWTKKQKDQWCEYLGIITLFAKDFRFPAHTDERSNRGSANE